MNLDGLYDRAVAAPGWLSHLEVSGPIDSGYLIWRDDAQAVCEEKLKRWMKQTEFQGGIELANAETQEERIEAVANRIKEIEIRCQSMDPIIAEAYREHLRYRHLVLLRSELRLHLEPKERIPDWKLERARAYRLDDLLAGQLNKKFMVCPVHKEKHGSLHVTHFGFCFGCLRSWDSISWLMEFDGLTFVQAVDRLST